jgi:hypothetical protein
MLHTGLNAHGGHLGNSLVVVVTSRESAFWVRRPKLSSPSLRAQPVFCSSISVASSSGVVVERFSFPCYSTVSSFRLFYCSRSCSMVHSTAWRESGKWSQDAQREELSIDARATILSHAPKNTVLLVESELVELWKVRRRELPRSAHPFFPGSSSSWTSSERSFCFHIRVHYYLSITTFSNFCDIVTRNFSYPATAVPYEMGGTPVLEVVASFWNPC